MTDCPHTRISRESHEVSSFSSPYREYVLGAWVCDECGEELSEQDQAYYRALDDLIAKHEMERLRNQVIGRAISRILENSSSF
jgi:hypothetical protein